MAKKVTRKGRERIRVSFSCKGSKIRTKQSFREECDINHIMARWIRTGVLDHLAANPPIFGNFDHGMDYQSACNQVIEADRAFDALPSSIRDRFHNDPAELIDFMDDPDNHAESQELGLRRKPTDPAPPPTADPGPRAQPPVPDTRENLPAPASPTPVAGGE